MSSCELLKKVDNDDDYKFLLTIIGSFVTDWKKKIIFLN